MCCEMHKEIQSTLFFFWIADPNKTSIGLSPTGFFVFFYQCTSIMVSHTDAIVTGARIRFSPPGLARVGESGLCRKLMKCHDEKQCVGLHSKGELLAGCWQPAEGGGPPPRSMLTSTTVYANCWLLLHFHFCFLQTCRGGNAEHFVHSCMDPGLDFNLKEKNHRHNVAPFLLHFQPCTSWHFDTKWVHFPKPKKCRRGETTPH